MLKFLRKKTKHQEAEQIYKEMKSAIQGIADTKGFEKLIEWWEREYQWIDDNLGNLRGEELILAVKERDVIKKHLQWLENIK